MNHQQRWAACRLVTERILKKYGEDVLATGVTGSVGRGADAKNSDIDFNVLVRDSRRLHSHRFVLGGCLFSVAARTEGDWVEELTRPNYGLPLVVGSLKSMRVIYDPSGDFNRLRKKAESLPAECWGNAVRVGLEEMVEDLGRVRNAHLLKDWKNFRLQAPHVALEAALVYSSLRRRAVLTEKDLLDRKTQRYTPRFMNTLMVGSGMKKARAGQVLNSLETLFNSLCQEAKNQGATPVSYDSASSYTPP